MIRALLRAAAQLLDPALLGTVLLSALGAALVLAASWYGVAFGLEHVRLFATGWLDTLARISAGLAAILLSLALFGTITTTIAGLLLERVARAVERRFYPGLPPACPQPLGEQIRAAASFLATAILVNLLALPLFLIWGANVAFFLAINGYLLGREYFELVAMRRVDRATATYLRKAHPVRIGLAGVAIAALSLLPLANLVLPVSHRLHAARLSDHRGVTSGVAGLIDSMLGESFTLLCEDRSYVRTQAPRLRRVHHAALGSRCGHALPATEARSGSGAAGYADAEPAAGTRPRCRTAAAAGPDADPDARRQRPSAGRAPPG